MTFSAGVLHEVKEEDVLPRRTSTSRKGVFKGFGSEALCRASVWRLKEEGEVLSFTVQISISVFWSAKTF